MIHSRNYGHRLLEINSLPIVIIRLCVLLQPLPFTMMIVPVLERLVKSGRVAQVSSVPLRRRRNLHARDAYGTRDADPMEELGADFRRRRCSAPMSLLDGIGARWNRRGRERRPCPGRLVDPRTDIHHAVRVIPRERRSCSTPRDCSRATAPPGHDNELC